MSEYDQPTTFSPHEWIWARSTAEFAEGSPSGQICLHCRIGRNGLTGLRDAESCTIRRKIYEIPTSQ